MSWLISLITGLGAIVALFVSKPERKWALWACVILISFTSGLTAYEQWDAHRTKTEIQALAYGKLSIGTRQFLETIANMIKEASNEWLPSNQAELFSRRSIDLICRELNADGQAPVVPRRPWYQWLAQNAKEYKTVLNEVLRNYSHYLSRDLIRAVSNVEQSLVISWPISLVIGRQVGEQHNVEYPPVLCSGLEDALEKSFAELRVLSNEIRKGPHNKKEENWLQGLRHNSVTLGANRFGPRELAEWAAAHPSSPFIKRSDMERSENLVPLRIAPIP